MRTALLSLAVIACVAPPEQGEPQPQHVRELPSLPGDLCSLEPRPEPSAAASVFSAGGAVEAALLRGLSLSREKVGFDATLMSTYFPWDRATTLPHVPTLLAKPLDAPIWQAALVDDVRAAAANACAVRAGRVAGRVVRELALRNEMGELDPVPELDASLGDAFAQVFAGGSAWPATPAHGTIDDARPKIEALEQVLEPETARALARVVLGMAKAEAWRLEAVQPWYPGAPDLAALSRSLQTSSFSLAQIRTFDQRAMARGAIALADAVGRLAARLREHPLPEDLAFELETPLGLVRLSGLARDDEYAGLAAPALIVDQRGSDTYRGAIAGPTLAAVPLSVVIDVSGDDHYVASDVDFTQGAGRLSFGFLFDLAGDDEYRARDFAQGAGFLGVGVLFDVAGRDQHFAHGTAQGAAMFGLAAAIDLDGDDSWRLLSQGQGFGFTRGVGLLLDAAGDDVYDADDVNITVPSAQDPMHNTSLAQGAGYGYRGDSGANAMNGGTGLLVDLRGNDRYACGVFCQGTGYWFGTGVLYDGDGDDAYRGVWYVQGGAAHFAFATLIDERGDDEYVATRNMSQGAGHEGSVGVLIEGGGNDRYALTHLSHGGANDGSQGYFVELGGDDVYGSAIYGTGAAFGQNASADYSGHPFANLQSLAVFLDLGGSDDYASGAAPAAVKNGATWKLATEGWVGPRQLSFGEDR